MPQLSVLAESKLIKTPKSPKFTMVNKTKVPPEIVDRWRAYRDRRLAEGHSFWAIAGELAGDFSHRTVYRQIYGAFRERERTRECLRYRQHREAKSRWHPLRQNVVHDDPVAYRTAYQRNYKKLTRRPECFLATILASRSEADLSTITLEVRRLAEGVNFYPETIRRILKDYVSRARGPPYLRETDVDVWTLQSQEENDY